MIIAPGEIVCLDLEFAADPSFSATNWHHLAATYDGSNMKLYKDGVLILQRTGLQGVVGNPLGYNSTNPVYFGAQNDRSRFFNGYMSGIKFYSRALTAEEVSCLWQQRNR